MKRKKNLKVFLLLLIAFLLVVNIFSSFSDPCKDPNSHIAQYNLLVSKLKAIPQLHLVANFKFLRRVNLQDAFFHDGITVIVNSLYSRDLFFDSEYLRFDPRYLSCAGEILQFERKNNMLTKYGIADVEHELGVGRDELQELFRIMHSLDVEVVDRTGKTIEFTNESFLYSTSLDYCEGFLYSDVPIQHLSETNSYAELNLVRPSWYEFKKDRSKTTDKPGCYVPIDLHDSVRELDQIFDDDAMRNKAKRQSEDGFVQSHHQLWWILDEWGLWRGSRLSKYFTDLGITRTDHMTDMILRSYWRYVNQKPLETEKLIALYRNAENKSKTIPANR